jgi:hypothetical protein
VSSLVIVRSRSCSVAPVASGGRGALRPAHAVVSYLASIGLIPRSRPVPRTKDSVRCQMGVIAGFLWSIFGAILARVRSDKRNRSNDLG